MLTYSIYNFIIISTVIFAYLYEKTNSEKKQRFFLFVAFAIPFFFLAIRYDVGQDYHNYVYYYHIIADGIPVPKEPAYVWLNQIIAHYNLSVQWLFVFFGFFTMLFIYIALPKEGFSLSIFLFLVIFYFLWAFTSLRETLVMAIMFYASKYIKQRRFFPYFAWFLVGASFHLMIAILSLIIYPVADRKTNRFLLIGIIASIFIMVTYTDVAYTIITSVVHFFPKYSWYIDSKFMLPASTSAGLLGPLIKLLIGVTVIFSKEKIINKYPNANIAINLYFVSLLGSILLLDISIFSRFEAAYMLYFLLAITYFIKTFKSKTRIIIVVLLCLFYYLMLIRYVSIATKDIENGLYLQPYRTILTPETDENVYLR